MSLSSETLDAAAGFEGAAEIIAAWHAGMAPEPALLVSDWADRHRMLGSRGSAEPGPWRTSRTPYLRQIMDVLSPTHPARRVVLMKGAQVGGTECGNNWIGYVIQHAPGPMLAVQPTTELAKRFSEQRIDPLVEETPAIRERVAPVRSRDSGNRQLSKEFPGGQLVMTGANSAVGLRSMSARFLFLDEIDAYPGDVEGEGDPVALAEARARTFGWRRKTLLVSTPTITGVSRIEREYLATDQQRYFVPCPFCGHMQSLRFARLIWARGQPDSARYHCEACDGAVGEQHKTAMLAHGQWRPTAAAQDPHAIGFHLSALYSPVGWFSWAQAARDWEAAQGDARALKTFHNTVLGDTWQERGDAPDYERLIERREPMVPGLVPNGAVVLTAGVDNQSAPARLEVYVWAWGPGYESWLVHHERIEGSPADPEPWDTLAGLLGRSWERLDGGQLRIAKVGVDTGGNHTAGVYTQLRRLRDPRLVPLKGIEGWNRSSPVTGPTLVDVTEAGRKLKRGLNLWTVAVSTYKLDLYRRLWLSRGDGIGYPPGWVHLPDWLDGSLVKQLVAEQLVTHKTRNGFARNEWRKLRDNEALDCAVYARAALAVLGSDRYGERFWAIMGSQIVVPQPEPALPVLPARPGTAVRVRPRQRVRSSIMD